MKKKKDIFITKAEICHYKRYSYAFFDYINAKTKSTITCPIHGNFNQRPDVHLAGHGCPACSGKLKKNIDDFITQATTIHHNKYSYGGFIYKGALQKGVICCQIHGNFEQSPNAHLAGKGCPQCAKNSQYSQTTYIKKANAIHHHNYQYSNTNYTNALQKIDIICLIHGPFTQRADAHLRGDGCPKCAKKNQKKTVKQFIVDAKKIHGKRYNYSLFEYHNMRTKGIIICSIHGPFFQLPINHLAGSGCQKCALQRRKKINNINKQPPIKLLQPY